MNIPRFGNFKVYAPQIEGLRFPYALNAPTEQAAIARLSNGLTEWKIPNTTAKVNIPDSEFTQVVTVQTGQPAESPYDKALLNFLKVAGFDEFKASQ